MNDPPLVEGEVDAQDVAERFPSDDHEESIPLNPEERTAVRKGLEKANELEKEVRDLREKDRADFRRN